MKRFFVLVVSAVVLSSCASSSDEKQKQTAPVADATSPADRYSSEAKTIPVGVIPAAVLHDAARNKDLELSIDYPTHGGPYPVVIFSHGYGVPRNAYVGMSSFWASHGYVVIRPHHADLGTLKLPDRTFDDMPRDRRRRPPIEPKATEFRADPSEQWQSQTAADWTNRAGDVTFVINSLPKLIEQYPEIKDRIDSTRIGVGGHSYGAFVALLLGGAKALAGGDALTYADPRVKAIEAMSPPGPSADRGLTQESFSTIKIPALFLTGSRDFGAVESENWGWRKQAFALAPAGDKWFVSVNGIGTPAFTGIIGPPSYEPPVSIPSGPPLQPLPGPAYPGPSGQQQSSTRQNPDAFRQMGMAGTARTVSLAFWDVYLKNDAVGRAFLAKLKERSDLQVESK